MTGSEVAAAVVRAHRQEWAFVLAATARVTGDLGTAEEAVQDAYAAALSAWPEQGIPARPGAWLTTVARRRALDLRRRTATAVRALPTLAQQEQVREGTATEDDPDSAFPDDRLRLVFTCCHPALAPAARIALTLRMVCGLTTAEVARALLVTEPTMAARITRAKKKIATARIPYRVPELAELPARLAVVLDVVHLVFTTGHAAPIGDLPIRRSLTERARDLAAMLRALMPDEPEVAGLAALILLTDARTPARIDRHGAPVLLADQDRTVWNDEDIVRGTALMREALHVDRPGRFALLAAIAAVHDRATAWADTDWAEIVRLYDRLAEVWPSPVVALNHAVAIGMADGPEIGLAALDLVAGEPSLAGYGYLPAARADFLAQLGRHDEARLAYAEAAMLTANTAERRLLEHKAATLPR